MIPFVWHICIYTYLSAFGEFVIQDVQGFAVRIILHCCLWTYQTVELIASMWYRICRTMLLCVCEVGIYLVSALQPVFMMLFYVLIRCSVENVFFLKACPYICVRRFERNIFKPRFKDTYSRGEVNIQFGNHDCSTEYLTFPARYQSPPAAKCDIYHIHILWICYRGCIG